MAESAYTRGPWKTHKRQDEPLPTLVLGGEFADETVADCSSWQTGRGFDEAAANARLIAAAPDLVEALESLLVAIDAHSGIRLRDMHHERKAARAALSRALGQEG